MLLVHSSLALGGIETFFLRLAKERHRTGLRTKILLIAPRNKSNQMLVKEAEKYAEVVFLEYLSAIPAWATRSVPYHLSMLIPLASSKISMLLEDVRQIHVTNGISAYFSAALLRYAINKPPITIGLYHSSEFSWGGVALPFFERMNRQMFYKLMPKQNIVFFNEKLPERHGAEFFASQVFPIGVTNNVDCNSKSTFNNPPTLVIGTVGRLVEFKTYHLWMLDVVKRLADEGLNVRYDIYGYGPLESEISEEIKKLSIDTNVRMLGKLDYANFADVVKSFDLFIGSGTAIIEAAHLGVPSIIGIEHEPAPLTYGFLSDLEGFSYNEDGLHRKHSAYEVISKFSRLSQQEKSTLGIKHISKSKMFSMESCSVNFERIPTSSTTFLSDYCSWFFKVKYSFSFLSYSLFLRLIGDSLNRRIRK